LLLKVVTFPLTVLTLGLFWLVINAFDVEGGGPALVPGFEVRGFRGSVFGGNRFERGEYAVAVVW